jgi:hypothetical protein
MDRSSTRNNFLDILADSNAVAMLLSIALHASLGAYILPLVSRSQPEGKKAAPLTVKVVELTPGELQRIPQVPIPAPTPRQVLPPVYQPSIPVAPTTPKIATSIPASPIRTTPKGASTKPPKGPQTQQSKPLTQPSPPTFNPDISLDSTPQPIESPAPKKKTTSTATPQPAIKPTPKPVKPAAKTPTSPKPQSEPPTDSDGEDNPPNRQPTSQFPTPTPNPSGSPNSNPATQPTPQPKPQPSGSGNPGNGGGGKFYGNSSQKANAQLQEYITKYPNLKLYPPKTISKAYPDGVPCSKVKQAPFIAMMAVFGKTPEKQDPNVTDITGENNANSDAVSIFADEDNPTNNKLSIQLAKSIAADEVFEAEKKRPEADKGKPVLYQYRVEFDPKSCKN